MTLIESIKSFWHSVVARFPWSARSRPRVQQPEEIEPPAPSAAPSTRAYNATQRKLERRRRRYDKFVTPNGELPEKTARPASMIKTAPKTPDESVSETAPFDEADVIVHGRHHEDEKDEGDVLYRPSEFEGTFNFRDSILDQL